MRNPARFYTPLLVSLTCASFAYSQSQESRDLFEMSFEEIAKLKVTTAGKREKKISEIPASVIVITRQEIETYGYTTLEDVLRNIPGLYLVDHYDWTGATNFGVRGFFSEGAAFDTMAIMVNGVNQNEAYYNQVVMGKIGLSVEAIDRIEVVRGPLSVIYGSGAFLGAINIITNEQSRDKESSLISGAAGSLGTSKLAARIQGKGEDFNFVFNASRIGTDGVDEPYSKMISIFPPEGSTAKKFRDSRKYFNLNMNYKEWSFDSSYSVFEKGMTYALPSIGRGSWTNIVSGISAVVYTHKISETLIFKGKFTHTSYRLESTYNLIKEDFYGFSHITADTQNLELNLFYTPSKNLDITMGLERNQAHNLQNLVDFPGFGPAASDISVRLPDDGSKVVHGIFANVDYRPTEKLLLVGGLRLDRQEKYRMTEQFHSSLDPAYLRLDDEYRNDAINVVPRLAAIYSMNENHVLKLMYGEAIKHPSFGQNVDLLRTPDKPQLKPAKVRTAELNYLATISPNIFMNLSIFRNDLDKLISRAATNGPNGEFLNFASNGGKMQTDGAELGLRLAPDASLQVELSGTYQNTKDLRPGYQNIKPGFAPDFLGYFRASYRPIRSFTIAINARYVGGMESNWDQTGLSAQEGQRIGKKVPSNTTFDTNLRFEGLAFPGLFVDLQVSNLFNKDVYYPTSKNNAFLDKGTLGTGRTFQLSIGYRM